MAVSIENPDDPRLAEYADLRTPRTADGKPDHSGDSIVRGELAFI